MIKTIAFFDFDGTITSKDTLFEFVRYCKGSFKLYLGIFLLSPYLLGLKLKLLSRKKAKEKFLTHFFNGMPVEKFNSLCLNFSSLLIPFLIRPKAFEKICWHKEKNHQIVVVTASPGKWVEPWCISQNIDCISTILEIKNDTITGKILGENCHGEEKVKLIKQKYDISQYDEIFVYGDSKGDKQMMLLGTSSYYKPFRK